MRTKNERIEIFCPYCGAKVEIRGDKESQKSDEELICKYCGMEINSKSIFGIKSRADAPHGKNQNPQKLYKDLTDEEKEKLSIDLFLEDKDFPLHFKQNLCLVLSRVIHYIILRSHPHFQLPDKKILILGRPLCIHIIKNLNFITHEQLNYGFLKDLHKLSIEEFDHWFTLLQEKMHNDYIYKYSFPDFLEWLIYIVFELLLLKQQGVKKKLPELKKRLLKDMKKFKYVKVTGEEEKKSAKKSRKRIFSKARPKKVEKKKISAPRSKRKKGVSKNLPIIARSFALLPETDDIKNTSIERERAKKKEIYSQTQKIFIKHRELKNRYAEIMMNDVRENGIDNYSSAHYGNTQNRLKLMDVYSSQYSSFKLTQKTKYSASAEAYSAVRNQIIRKENLKVIINQLIPKLRSDRDFAFKFLKGKRFRYEEVKGIIKSLKKDCFGSYQTITTYYLNNYLLQVRNLFLDRFDFFGGSNRNHFQEFIVNELKSLEPTKDVTDKILNAFTKTKNKKRVSIPPEDLPEHLLKLYCIKIKRTTLNCAKRILRYRNKINKLKAKPSSSESKWSEKIEEYEKRIEYQFREINSIFNLISQPQGKIEFETIEEFKEKRDTIVDPYKELVISRLEAFFSKPDASIYRLRFKNKLYKKTIEEMLEEQFSFEIDDILSNPNHYVLKRIFKPSFNSIKIEAISNYFETKFRYMIRSKLREFIFSPELATAVTEKLKEIRSTLSENIKTPEFKELTIQINNNSVYDHNLGLDLGVMEFLLKNDIRKGSNEEWKGFFDSITSFSRDVSTLSKYDIIKNWDRFRTLYPDLFNGKLANFNSETTKTAAKNFLGNVPMREHPHHNYCYFPFKLKMIPYKETAYRLRDGKRKNGKITNTRILEIIKKGYEPSHPALTFKNRKLLIHIPFQKKEEQSKYCEIDLDNDLVMGVDLGLIHFAVISIWNKKTKKEVARYFIGQDELFNKRFDPKTKKIVLQEKFRGKDGELDEKNCKKANIKRKLINLNSEIRGLQSIKSNYESRHPDFKDKYKWNDIRRRLSSYWNKLNKLNRQIVRYLNHWIIAIAKSWGVSEIKVEDLGWSSYKKKRDAGKYLSFWRIQWFFSQVQSAVELQCKINGIGFKKIPAPYTSQDCCKCGERGTRDGKLFVCENHLTPFRIDADLNAARVIAQS